MAQILESPETGAAKKPETTDRPPVPETDLEHGLTSAEAEKRLAQYGENSLIEHHISTLERLLRFFWGPIPWMIEVAAVPRPCSVTGTISRLSC